MCFMQAGNTKTHYWNYVFGAFRNVSSSDTEYSWRWSQYKHLLWKELHSWGRLHFITLISSAPFRWGAEVKLQAHRLHRQADRSLNPLLCAAEFVYPSHACLADINLHHSVSLLVWDAFLLLWDFRCNRLLLWPGADAAAHARRMISQVAMPNALSTRDMGIF